MRQVLQKCLFVGREKQLERFTIDIENTDFAHALTHEFRMHISENAEVDDAALADIVHQLFDTAEIFNPERNWRMLKQTFGVLFMLALLTPGFFARSHIFNGQKNAIDLL